MLPDNGDFLSPASAAYVGDDAAAAYGCDEPGLLAEHPAPWTAAPAALPRLILDAREMVVATCSTAGVALALAAYPDLVHALELENHNLREALAAYPDLVEALEAIAKTCRAYAHAEAMHVEAIARAALAKVPGTV